MPNTVNLTLADDVAVVEIDNPPVNALSHGVPEGLMTGHRGAPSGTTPSAPS